MPRQYTPHTSCMCLLCGNPFSRPPSAIANGRGRYCSKACMYAACHNRLLERFWSRVDRSDSCWEWTGPLEATGYARFWLRGRNEYVHRFAYEATYGPVPTGLHVLHHCDNRKCCRPDHLFLGTHRDNMDDKVAKGRQRCGEDNGWSKLTTADVLAIRAAASQTTRTALARQYGVAITTVSRIVAGRTWKHLRQPPVQLSLPVPQSSGR